MKIGFCHMAGAFYITGKDDDMKKAANIMLWIGIMVAACIMAWFLFQVWREEAWIADAIEQDMELVEKAVEEPADVQEETEEDDNMLREVNWEMLRDINLDITGWLYIPDTEIDYPVLQEQEGAKGFYLDHDFRGDELASGAVFFPAQPYPDVEDAHTLVFVLVPHRMTGNGMFPSPKDGDLCLFYRLEDAHTGDVTLYEADGEIRVGRIVAVPGQTVKFPEEGGYLVNGYAPYEELPYETYGEGQYVLREDEYFVLNDYRSNDRDSRTYGVVEKGSMRGKLLFVLRRRGF